MLAEAPAATWMGEVEDAAVTDRSLFPLRDHGRASELALQQDHLQGLAHKSRLSYADKQLKNLDRAYGPLLQGSFSQPASSGARERLGTRLDDRFFDLLTLQWQTIALKKKQASPDDEAAGRRGRLAAQPCSSAD